MAEQKTQVSNEKIESFLQGNDKQEFIVAVESYYDKPYVTLVINDEKNGGKKTENHPYQPFLWFKEDITKIIYGGKKMKTLEACKHFDVKITKLRTSDENGYSPERMKNGYIFMAKCKRTYNDLIKFFKQGGVDVFSQQYNRSFVMFSATEQFLIQSGKRLFKGMDDYNDVHRFQFDLETEGLFASRDAIFQIGVRDNRGLEGVLETTGDTLKEKRDSERKNLIKFFQVIAAVQPDIITGYNSENFDWPFIFERANRLGMDITEFVITLSRLSKIKRKPATLKLGGETEAYNQTHMFGYNILDISHAVRRAMAINSEIKGWGLKYITQYSEIAKPNRVYVPGDKINTTWADKVNEYAFNNKNGDWYKITKKNPLQEGYVIKTGAYIVQRYLCDDLWETEQIDNIFNQASFLIAKMLPTTFQRSSTMGTAGQWKLIMSAWSYENGLAIPETQKKREFTGGLSRLLEVGFAKNVYKLDYAALYPKTQLTHGIFPDLDISGVMRGTLTYVVDSRDKFKFLNGKEKKIVKTLETELKDGSDTLSDIEKEELTKRIQEHKALANLYDKKQLPLKILANSWFGSYGAPYIFNWGDTDSAEETTCRGRQYLRLMVRFFYGKYNFRPLVGDSVTYDTPIYLLNNKTKQIEIKPICDIFDQNSQLMDKEGLRDYDKKPYLVLTVNGWKGINYVYRHGTDKNIHRVSTKNRLVCVTEDHSLFQNGKQIKPSSLKRFDKVDVYDYPIYNCGRDKINEELFWLYGFFLGDGSSVYGPRKQYYKSKKTGEVNTNKGVRAEWKISNKNLEFLERLQSIIRINFPNVKTSIKNHIKSSGVYNLVVYNTEVSKWFSENFYTSYREKMIPPIVLNTSTVNKKAFMDGVCASDGYGNDLSTVSDIGMKSQVAMAGIGYLLKDLKIDYKLKLRKDKENFISFKLRNRNRNNSEFTEKTKMKSDEIWLNEPIKNKDKENYVYDISTEDGTFIGGIGAINLKNTDGFNFAAPDNLDTIKYTAKGSHWKTIDDGGKELIGIDAVLAEFNETYMEGRMGLDLDDVCSSTINFARKNYANDIGGKIKLVGNSIKSKKMPVYIEEFLNKGIRMLLDGDGYSFINHYYDYVDKIYNYKIPLVKMASKSKVKLNIADYKKKATMKNKAGNPMPKQAHMELAIKDGLEINLGDTLFYINTGTSKSHGDLKTVDKNKMTKKERDAFFAGNGRWPEPNKVVELNCKLINPEIVERDYEAIKELEMLKKAISTLESGDKSISEMEVRVNEIEKTLYTDEYNVPRYLEAFNKKIKPLLVCFNDDIRANITLDIIKEKDKETKKTFEVLKERTIFTKGECDLVSGKPFKDSDQDSYEDLMIMEDKEIKFWDKVNKLPNNMEESEWVIIRADYHERLRIAKLNGIKEEKEKLESIFKHLEVADFKTIRETRVIPTDVFLISYVSDDDSGELISRKWEEPLCNVFDIFKYEKEAIERNKFYNLKYLNDNENRYELWLDYLLELKIMTGDTITSSSDEQELSEDELFKIFKEKSEEVVVVEEVKEKKKRTYSEDGDDDELEEDENGNLIRTDEEIILDDEFDDTFGEVPEGYVVAEYSVSEKSEEVIIVEEKDEWGF